MFGIAIGIGAGIGRRIIKTATAPPFASTQWQLITAQWQTITTTWN
jgi:hypothetical protein